MMIWARVQQHAQFLHSLDVHQHAIQAEYALLQSTGLVLDLACLGGRFASRLAFNGYVKVDELVGESRHIVDEAEGIFANSVACQDIVALTLTNTGNEDLARGVFDFPINVERASGLNLNEHLRASSLYPRCETYSKVELGSVSYEYSMRRNGTRTPIF